MMHASLLGQKGVLHAAWEPFMDRRSPAQHHACVHDQLQCKSCFKVIMMLHIPSPRHASSFWQPTLGLALDGQRQGLYTTGGVQ